jgi:DNA-directed RNA polymerase specialized sigma24 family protein
MGDIGTSGGETCEAPGGGTPRRHGRRREREQDAGLRLAELYHLHYRSLFRLAALLTGDTGSAEEVVQDSFTTLQRLRNPPETCDAALARLRRLVVARARPAARHHRLVDQRTARRPGHVAGPHEAPPFENSAVVLALRALPAFQREAAVLTLYLSLTEEQAAAAMRVSRAALRRNRAAARTRLRAALPGI